jgi:hypothetical protein
MFREYKALCDRGELEPGSIWLWKGDSQWVLNFATKKHWRNPSKLVYVETGLKAFQAEYEQLGIREIAFPRLGCGNGGLDWNDVRPLMLEKLQDLPIPVYIHDFEKPIGRPEHELPLMAAHEPNSFTDFLDDIREVIEKRGGWIDALKMQKQFKVYVDGDMTLCQHSSCEDPLASREDLFRIWSLLLDAPVCRVDLPDKPHENALKLFSVLAELPYARPVNIADKRGRNNLAIEFRRRMNSNSVQLATSV